MIKATRKKIRTSLKSPSGKVVFKKKIGSKVQAVNNAGNPVKVDATKCQLKKAGLPQRVQSSQKKQGYNSRANESLGMKNKGKKTQGFKARRNERHGEQLAFHNMFNLIK